MMGRLLLKLFLWLYLWPIVVICWFLDIRYRCKFPNHLSTIESSKARYYIDDWILRATARFSGSCWTGKINKIVELFPKLRVPRFKPWDEEDWAAFRKEQEDHKRRLKEKYGIE